MVIKNKCFHVCTVYLCVGKWQALTKPYLHRCSLIVYAQIYESESQGTKHATTLLLIVVRVTVSSTVLSLEHSLDLKNMKPLHTYPFAFVRNRF